PRMTPDQRRDMLVAATLPLVTRYGRKVTTKQISEAAGVAEGTIFRVFPDKESLIEAAVARGLDPEPTLSQLAAVDLRAPLRERLVTVVDILQRRFIAVFQLMLAMGMHGPPRDVEAHRAAARARHAAVLEEVGRILAPDRAEFRCPVPEVVRIIRLLTFSGSHPLIADGKLLTPDEITDVLLHGTLRHSGDKHAPGDDADPVRHTARPDHERGQSSC
ncbi:MAG TPA: TetR/AcrR family transcriptional regulator, partial [Pilimelia sp.]|nr:TetR/AcrR family transcriptional regulator [Pilimelia sp.]